MVGTFATRLRRSENVMLLLVALLLGMTTGIGVYLFRSGIDLFTRIYREPLLQALGFLGVLAIILVIGLAGLIAGFIFDRTIGEERHHGVAGIVEATALANGHLRYFRMPIKALLSAFALGAGASAGPEDPSVQIGANLGSAFGSWLGLSGEHIRLLVAAGAAGGVAAAFRAPIAGVFFALEIILGDFSTSSFGVVVLTAVVASVMIRAIEGGSPVFILGSEAGQPELGIINYALGGIAELPLYIILGLLIAPVSALFIRLMMWQQDLWHGFKVPTPIKTMVAGMLVGVIAIAFPQVMGTGRDTMNALVNTTTEQYLILFLIGLAIAKMIATSISLNGGFIGGIFAPTLLVGASLGRAFGMIVNGLFPGAFTANPAAFALAGMAASMTGVIRSPITAVLLMFELTNDYNLILPIMLVTAVCLIVVERLAPEGFYQLSLSRKGVRISRARDVDLLQTVWVGDTMTREVQTVSASLPAENLPDEFDKTGTHGLVVIDAEGKLVGIVTLQDLIHAQQNEGLANHLTLDIAKHTVLTVTPQTPISEALHIIGNHDFGRLPVVDPDDNRKLVGLLRRRDIVRAYELALERKVERTQKLEGVRLTTYSGAHVIEARVQDGSQAAEHKVREIQWPKGNIVAAVRHHGDLIVPNGDTLLHAGDLLTVVTTPGRESDLVAIVGRQKSSAHHG